MGKIHSKIVYLGLTQSYFHRGPTAYQPSTLPSELKAMLKDGTKVANALNSRVPICNQHINQTQPNHTALLLFHVSITPIMIQPQLCQVCPHSNYNPKHLQSLPDLNKKHPFLYPDTPTSERLNIICA